MSDMFERNLPQPGERWQHFKGNEYWIIAIAQHSQIYFDSCEQFVIYTKRWIDIVHELANGFNFIAEDTESGVLYEVRRESEKWYLRPAINPITDEPTDRKPIAWARPLDNFMEVVSSDSGDRSSNCYRFERIESIP